MVCQKVREKRAFAKREKRAKTRVYSARDKRKISGVKQQQKSKQAAASSTAQTTQVTCSLQKMEFFSLSRILFFLFLAGSGLYCFLLRNWRPVNFAPKAPKTDKKTETEFGGRVSSALGVYWGF